MQERIDIDIDALIDTLPSNIKDPLRQRENLNELLEIVLDLGREPEARFLNESGPLASREVTQEDIQTVIDHIGAFGGDDRAGIERTLHRISAIRNRSGKVIGLTLRVGRAVYGTIKIIEDLIFTGKSVLLLGRPGVGKTTMLREVARVLADDALKRVIIVDTSNEIAGDGDIPHQGIGRARRMQVQSPDQQHAIMIQAVENHMPEVIIIDEIGTELEANAARTIAERGVQLVATAHGNTLENLIMNPTLSDLVGGVQSVTLGDVEARRRRTQKTVRERKAPPTFDILVEIKGWNEVVVHSDVTEVVDRLLRGFQSSPEIRRLGEDKVVERIQSKPQMVMPAKNGNASSRVVEEVVSAPEEEYAPPKVTNIMPYGVNKGKLQQAVRGLNAPVELVADIGRADLLLTTKNFYRRRTQALQVAEENGKPVYVLRKNTLPQIQQFIQAIARKQGRESEAAATEAIKEAEQASAAVGRGEKGHAELDPQSSYVRRLQHQIVEKHGLASSSMGREPDRHVVIFRR